MGGVASTAGGSGRPGGSSLPLSRSFVVQFSGDTTPVTGCYRGRVEHIDSGRSTRFGSLDELVAFVAETLATWESGDPA